MSLTGRIEQWILAALCVLVVDVSVVTAQQSRISLSSSGGEGNHASTAAAVSANGRFVAFQSLADDLVANDTNHATDVFLRDRVLGTTARISVGPGGVEAVSDSLLPAISADGRFVAFLSYASNLVASDTNSVADVFVYDRVTHATTRVSVATGGGQGTAMDVTERPAISADGRYVAFASAMADLVPGDTNAVQDVFVHDRRTGTTTRVDVTSGSAQALGGASGQGAISGDGRFVAFASAATNLVAGDANGRQDIFLHDRQTGATTRVSLDTSGTAGNGDSTEPSLSRDGRYVAFSSLATNLGTDTNGVSDVFVRDTQLNTTVRASVATGGAQGNAASLTPVLDADGRHVVFVSRATNFMTVPPRWQVFIRDLQALTTTVVSRNGEGFAADADCEMPAISADGRYVSFASAGTNLVDHDANARYDVFLFDNDAFRRERASVRSDGSDPDVPDDSYLSALSRDGRYVVFTSLASLTPDDTGRSDVYVRDRVLGTTTRVSVASGGVEANGWSWYGVISDDGRYVAFASDATNLVPADTNGAQDIFVHDAVTGTTTRVNVASDGTQGSGFGGAYLPAITGDGRYVTFTSWSPNLVPGDTNGQPDVFVHDMVLGTTTRVSIASDGAQGDDASGNVGQTGAAISADGRFVAFDSSATNLVPDDTNGGADVFVRDTVAGTTTRVSVNTAGTQGDLGSRDARMTRDGRYVLFISFATNLVPGDANGLADAFVHDRETGSTVRVTVSSEREEADQAYPGLGGISDDGRYVVFSSPASTLLLAGSDTNGRADTFVRDLVAGVTTRVNHGPADAQSVGDLVALVTCISGDGRVVAFSSRAGDLDPPDVNGSSDIHVRAATPELHQLTPASGPTAGGTTLTLAGVGFAPGTTVSLGGSAATFIDDTSRTALALTSPAHAEGNVDVAVSVPGFATQRLVYGFTYFTLAASPTADTDGDGLTDAFEAQYGLDVLTPDATADADGDGVSNLAEQAAGTHPNGVVTRYLAEGATGGFFSTTLALANPGAAQATVLLRYLLPGGVTSSQLLSVAPHSRATVDPSSVAGLEATAFSTVLESDRLVVLDRTMRWGTSGYGSHAETAMSSLATTWYLAEGSTTSFDLFYLLQNPSTNTAHVEVKYLLPAPAAPIVVQYVLGPQSRTNIWVNLETAALAHTDVSGVITSDVPIAVERSMYLTTPGKTFAAGHESAGVSTPSTTWFLAEGATGSYFDLFLLLANPSTSPADVRATYLKPDGSTIVRTYRVEAESRFNIWLDVEDPALADTAVSTTIEVTNNIPIIVERSMWWPGPTANTWQEAHNSPGATSAGTAWAVASGEDGGTLNADTYILVANTATFAAKIRVTLMLENGTTRVRTYDLPPRSRFNVAIRGEFPDAVGTRFAATVESIGLGGAPIVVEQAVYSDAGTDVWAAGSNALGTRLR